MYRARNYLIFCVATVLIFAGIAGVVSAYRPGAGVDAGHPTSATPVTSRLVAKHVVNMSKVPAANLRSAKPQSADASEDDQPGKLQQLKEAAASNHKAPAARFAYQPAPTGRAYTPPPITSFQGMADSNAICPPVGCVAPDQALATSPNWVFQGVNTSFAVYSPSGTLQSGWPKTAQSFFGVPNPPNGCASVPYLIDVRAFYDPNDDRFWAAILQDEDAFGMQTGCPFQAQYWIAVSQTNNPNGSWNVYAFDMALGTTNGVDFTQFGFDAQAIYFTGNMFNQSGSTFQYAEVFAASKALMESGASVTPKGFSKLKLNGVAVDSVQPVETQAYAYGGPNVGLFVNTLNYNFGGYACGNGCQGLVVWAMANPLSANPSLTSAFVNTTTYTLSPYADQPGCTRCLDTDETQITGTPVYHDGLISWAINSGVNNGTQTVPGIFWGQVSPTVNSAGAITGAALAQSGYLSYQGDTAAYYGTLMPDADNNLFMVFYMSSSTLNPQLEYIARPATFTPGLFPDNGNTLKAGDAHTVETRWGDFSAASYDGPATNNVWLAGQFASSNGFWSTYIAKTQVIFTNPNPTPTPTPSPTPTSTPSPTPTATMTPTPTSTPGSSTYRAAVLADHPVLYYRLDESSGTTAADSSGNGFNGTYTSNATLNQPGATTDGDTAISTSNGLAVQYSNGTGLPTGSSARSVEVWFKTTGPLSSPYGSTLVSWGTETGLEQFTLKIYSSTQLKLTNWTYANFYSIPSKQSTLDGKWHYVVVTFDGSNAIVYYDGQSLGSQSFSTNTVLSSSGLTIGAQSGSNDSPYVGFIDEIAIYNTVLTAAQVQAHYNAH